MFHIQYTAATAVAEGDAWRRVCCGHCGADFVFLVAARVEFKEVELYSRGSPRQRERAERGAEARLAQRFARVVEPVPCATCGLYQPDMCRELRQQRYGWLRVPLAFLLAVGFGGLFTAALIAADDSRPLDRDLFAAVATAGGVASALFAAASAAAAWLSQRFDPNDPASLDERRLLAGGRSMTAAEFGRAHPGEKASVWLGPPAAG
jgi:hypothetical protein